MKILLTGHRGFIGSHLKESLGDDYDLVCVDKVDGFDLCDATRVNSLPDVDIVLHLAAFNGTCFFYDQPYEVAYNNTIPTLNLLNRYRKTQTKFVFASTCEIFSGAIDKYNYPIPTDEQVPIVFDDIKNPRWSYSLPKALGENMVINSGLDWVVIRYFNIYGPRQTHHFISEFVERAQRGDYSIYGNDTRSFCYVDDAVELTKQVMKASQNQIVNIGQQTERRISDIAKTILDIMHINSDLLIIKDGKPGSVTRRCPDTSRLFELTGFDNYTPIEVGLKHTLKDLL